MIDTVVDHEISDDGAEISTIYQKDGAVYLEKFSARDFSSISKSEITRINKG